MSSYGCSDIVPLSGGSRKFRIGCVVPARLNNWGHGIVRCPFKHTLYIFIVRSSTKYDSYCTHCVLTTNDACIHVMHFKLKKKTPKKSSKGDGRLVRQIWISICLYIIHFIEIRCHYSLNCKDAALSTLMVILQHVRTSVTRDIYFQGHIHLYHIHCLSIERKCTGLWTFMGWRPSSIVVR